MFTIKANELRIGNLVLEVGEDRPTKIVSSDIVKAERYQDWADPIPLTPLILEKCGFDKGEDGQGMQLLLKYDEENRFLVFNELGLHFSNESFAFWTYDCEHLHQLQNIYFALTQREI